MELSYFPNLQVIRDYSLTFCSMHSLPNCWLVTLSKSQLVTGVPKLFYLGQWSAIPSAFGNPFKIADFWSVSLHALALFPQQRTPSTHGVQRVVLLPLKRPHHGEVTKTQDMGWEVQVPWMEDVTYSCWTWKWQEQAPWEKTGREGVAGNREAIGLASFGFSSVNNCLWSHIHSVCFTAFPVT